LVIVGVESEGDEGLSLDDDEGEEEVEEEGEDLLCQMKRQRTPYLIKETLLSNPLTSWPHLMYWIRPTVLQLGNHQP